MCCGSWHSTYLNGEYEFFSFSNVLRPMAHYKNSFNKQRVIKDGHRQHSSDTFDKDCLDGAFSALFPELAITINLRQLLGKLSIVVELVDLTGGADLILRRRLNTLLLLEILHLYVVRDVFECIVVHRTKEVNLLITMVCP